MLDRLMVVIRRTPCMLYMCICDEVAVHSIHIRGRAGKNPHIPTTTTYWLTMEANDECIHRTQLHVWS